MALLSEISEIKNGRIITKDAANDEGWWVMKDGKKFDGPHSSESKADASANRAREAGHKIVYVEHNPSLTNDSPYDDYKEQRQRLERLLKEAQRNGDAQEAKDLQEEINELIKKGTKDSSDYDKKMFEKGYRYKIVLPSGMGEDLYARDFTSTKEMVKEYGTGTKTVELTKDGALSDLFGGALDPLLEDTERHAKDSKTKDGKTYLVDDYEIAIMDGTHLKFRLKGRENWASALHIQQVPDSMMAGLKAQGAVNGRFFKED